MLSTRFILKDSINENQIFYHRVIVAWITVIVAILLIIGRLIFLQVVAHERYTTLSENNRLKIKPLPPNRGLIYDRNGVLLANNRVSYSLEIIPEQIKDMEKTLNELSQIIAINETDIAQFKKRLQQTRSFIPIPLRYRLTEEEKDRFSVQNYRFNGVQISSNLNRYYPLGPIGVHMIGYVGRINEQELEIIDQSNYMGSDYIGKTGVEGYYEKELHGKTGFQHVETNVQGRTVRILESMPAVPGKNLYLNIDIDLQQYAESLVAQHRAAIVAIEPNSGGVLALVSMPYYDPNLFVDGIDVKTYRELRDSPDRPLFNRAIRGQYPPGSTIKPFVGLAGLEYGVRTERSRTWCRGWYSLKGQSHRYRDWKKSGHGSMNLHSGIEQSCDVYFYDLAYDLGIDRLYSFLTRFSFGKKTGIDISGELSGLIPSPEWKQKLLVLDKQWYAGETIIAGIGQGYMLTTPLQLAVATATLSARGQFKQPRVVFAMEEEESFNEISLVPTHQEILSLKQESYWDAAIGGMKAVVHGSRGTAGRIGLRSPYYLAGKTGTAQVITIKQNERYNAKRIAKKFHDHALFVAFAPLDEPRIALAIIVENGGGGSKTAAPIAKQVMDYYLLRKPSLQVATKNSP
jgi:penicillin-binding protein 2